MRVTVENLEIFAYGVDYPFTGAMLSTWVFGCFFFRSKERENTGELLPMIKAGPWG